MAIDVSDSPSPRPLGRGLDLAGLAATGLEGTASPTPPVVEGYSIEGLLGTGGLGHVWKAVRLADASTVALKIPHQADPAFVARLNAEADSLRTLDHPHVLRCLSHGTLPDGLPWLALEYVHGAPLSVLIPTSGFSWSEALGHFRRIAAAVVHAHSHGVLHRDLKPSNVLIGHDGSLKVADFGLARSVAERVVTFSLTLSGHIAGTAEYLAPECYARDYHPAEAADIYALGVILYELLAGHPPRGAWSPVSQQKQVDIRVDDVLRRALEPNPEKRFPSVQAMIDALELIARTPPRYSGTPRLTRAVRFLDLFWTIIGLFLFLGAFGLVVRIEKYGFATPVDLIGTETIRIGTYQAVVILLVCAAPFGLWQVLRLWRFRMIPLREALPSPFGLNLGTTTTAGVVILLSQLLFVLVPGILGSHAWREMCCNWLNPSSAPWEQGLVVTIGAHGRIAHDPWDWPETGKDYMLRERSGWITDPLSKQEDITSYWPGFMPRFILSLTVWNALAVALTVLSALSRWWRFQKWGRAIVLTVLLGIFSSAVQAEKRAREATLVERDRKFDRDRWYQGLYAGTTTRILVSHLFPTLISPTWRHPPTELMSRYAQSVDFGDGNRRSGEEIVRWLVDFADRSRAQHRSTEALRGDFFAGDWKDKRFRFQQFYFDFTDPPDGSSTGALTVIVLHGTFDPDMQAKATFQDIQTQPLWSVTRQPLDSAAAAAWTNSFLAALKPETGPAGVEKLQELVYSQLLQFKAYGVPCEPVSRGQFLDSLRSQCAAGSRPRLLLSPGPAATVPGGRQQLVLHIEDRGQISTWTVDLIFADGRWQCVRLVF